MITAAMIDSREPDWVQKLTFDGAATVVTLLDHGDVMATCEDGQILLIERKTPDDFLGSLRDMRIFNQLTPMLKITRWSYLMITGEFQRAANGNVITERGQTGWSWAAVQGALLQAQEMGIFVVFAGGDLDFEAAVVRLSQRRRDAGLLLEPPKIPHVLTAAEQIVVSLPGIGLERLEAVMDYCGTPAWALVALTDPTSTIPGVGAGVKTKIRKALGLQPDQQFCVMCADDGADVLTIGKLGDQ